MGLVLRSEFSDPPSPSVVADFRKHVRETGSPETWPLISTEHPPSDGEVRMLAQGISIKPKLRPDGQMAPCPICRPEKPKWMHDGALIWCASTQAVYCIGPDCSRGELRRKINVARNVLAQSEQERREIDQLSALAAHAPSLLAWSGANRALAAAATVRHRQFASDLPKLRHLLSRQLRQGLPAGVEGSDDPGALYRGRGFLTGGWNLQRDLDKADGEMRKLVVAAGEDPDAWAEALPPSVRTSRLREAQEALRLFRRVYDRVVTAAAFLSPATFGILARLSRHPLSLAEFNLSRTGVGATIEHREEFWRGSVSASPPSELPDLKSSG